MIKDLESQKAKLIADMTKIIEDHFEEFSKGSERPEFTIAEIEQLMVKQQEKTRETLAGSNGRLTSGMDAAVKKNALGAETR